ncbi:hypothetical protein DV096_18940 [Bradymonadaceae bacterium TMQ3]|uniref:Secreted protein n=1 Tax=Lujinxingia sediminis TaxID=2480984 RepID=A0ABY0CPQ0_9DELT|nr:hypothetical protein [Lujinxingia sediminis]RDV36529.1 hypothetical protein DV096_18940 [Bradymonadaceae bacterium TMQ3]RVU42381.1 hypothetical protein EA187_16010 [Lujinxingia sediminis]TXC74580.1 hypothetical protein FRC91_15830 [Bradymonadales bacterium TMQ1]
MSRKLILLLTLTLVLSALHLGCGDAEGPTADPDPTPDEPTTTELLAEAFTNVQLTYFADTTYQCECFPEDLEAESTAACLQENSPPDADELNECFLGQLADHPEADQAVHNFLVQVDELFDRHVACVNAIDTSSCSRDTLASIQSCGDTAGEELDALNEAAPEAVITYMDDTGEMLFNSSCGNLFAN